MTQPPPPTLPEIIGTIQLAEQLLREYRTANEAAIHPWAVQPLKHATGSLSASVSHLRAAEDWVKEGGAVEVEASSENDVAIDGGGR